MRHSYVQHLLYNDVIGDDNQKTVGILSSQLTILLMQYEAQE